MSEASRDAFRENMERLMGAAPSTLAELVATIGGTRAAAAELGTTQRSVERYINREEVGKTKYNRAISGTQRTLLEDAAARAQVRNLTKAIANKGLNANVSGWFRISQEQVYRTAYPFGQLMDEGELEETLDAMRSGDWDGAWDAFQEALLGAYMGDSTAYQSHFDDGDADEIEIWLGK